MIAAVIDPGSATIAGGLFGIFGLLLVAVLQNRRTHERVAQIEHSVNHIEEAPDSDGNGQVTLGQVVKGIATTQVAQGEAIHHVGQRVDGLSTNVDGLRSDFTNHIAAESVERQEVATLLAAKVDGVKTDLETGHRDHVAVDGLRDARHVKVEIDKDEPTPDKQG